MKESITTIEKVFPTNGSHPVLVYCNDLCYYVVKYKRSKIATNLFNEYIGSSFLQLWELGTPDFEFIDVKKEHVPIGLHENISPEYFDAMCFGTKFSRNYSDVTDFLTKSSVSWKKQFIHKEEILLIALFDMWIGNEDRNINNPNLMYDLASGNRFVPIDHQHIFNSSSLEGKLSQLTENDSILSHSIIKSLFKRNELKDQELVADIQRKYYLYIERCQQNLHNIISKIPADWNIKTEKYVQLIEGKIFSERWIRNTWINFVTLL